MTQQRAAGEPATAQPPKVHLNFLDSLRGLAAFYVLAFHVMQQTDAFDIPAHAPLYVRVSHVLSHGHTAVDIFIVISGFCLMIPISKSGGNFSRGLADFFKRRTRRIVPPYYAALVISVVVGLIQAQTDVRYHVPDGNFSAGFYVEWVAVHLAIVQNLSKEFNYPLNGPLWTVATEWQIYFLFAFVLVPIYRKLGPWATIAIAYVAGTLTLTTDIREACLWYAGLFAMGMAAADHCFSPTPKTKFSDTGLITGTIVFALLASCSRYLISTDPGLDPVTDLFEGLSTTCLLAYLTQMAKKPEGSPRNYVLRFLNLRPIVTLGVFSYSLYLVHAPLVLLAATYLRATNFSLGVNFALMYLVLIPCLVALAYVFHLIFERPFMNSLPASISVSPDSSKQDTTAVLPVL